MNFLTVNLIVLSYLVIHGNIVYAAWSPTEELDARQATLGAATYHKLVRPSEKTTVNVTLNLFSINDVDISTQQLSMTGWLSLEWEDSRLTWSTATHESEYFFALDSEIWKPEIYIDNSISDVSILADSALTFRVDKDGKVTWELPRIFNTHCDIDITYYPFDTQECAVEVVSWGLTTDELLMTQSRNEVYANDLKENGEWLFKSSTVAVSELEETRPDGTIEKFSLLTFTVKLQRRTTFYGKSILLPVVLTSFLVLLVFILPVDSGEKVGFSLTVLLALAVLLTLITDSIPRTSVNISILSTYLATALGLSVIICAATVVVIRIHSRDPSIKLSSFARSTARFLARASCYRGCCCGNRQITPSDRTGEDDAEAYRKDDTLDCDIFDDDYVFAWTEVAQILDWFLFVYMLYINSLSTLIFMMILAIGGMTQ